MALHSAVRTQRGCAYLSERLLGGGGPIYAIATTESVTVPVDAVLWLDDESAA
jgi:hypothetical protein